LTQPISTGMDGERRWGTSGLLSGVCGCRVGA
jgi:hypothetical protein